MKLIAKQGDKYVEIFKINFYKSKDASIIGEYLLFEHLQSLIPAGINFHSHFIYTEKGNYHFSLKYFDTVEKLFVDRKTFYNHVAVRKGINPVFSPTHPYERRNRIPGNTLDMFMMQQQMKPWSARPLGYQFGVVSITSTPNQLNNMKAVESKKICDEDLIVDLDQYKNMNINFRVSLFNKGNLTFDLSNLNQELTVIEKSIEKYGLILRIQSIISIN